MSQHAIKVINIGKKYNIGERIQYNTLRENISNFASGALSKFRRKDGAAGNSSAGINPNGNSTQGVPSFIWSLKNVSFEVKKGEIVGIIGNNGAGKSTLLKLISGITEPTEGRIEIYGRIGSLLEVGTGFHLELTGRENIYLNGAILGMRRREIERKFDEIVDFSGVEQFLDTPVKFYSSGMRVRLGFAVAAHLEPDILLLDEVLAVGDAAFQKKCLGKLDTVATSDGRTVLFISHDLVAIQTLCQRAILLENGKITAEGPTRDVVDQYLTSIDSIEDIPLEDRTDIDKNSDKSIIATSLKIENVEAGELIRPSSRIIFKLGYRSKTPVKNFSAEIYVKDFRTKRPITLLWSDNSDGIPRTLPTQGTIVCITDKMLITSGRCVVDIIFRSGLQLAYKLENAGFFNIEEEIIYGTDDIPRSEATFLLNHKWSLESE